MKKNIWIIGFVVIFIGALAAMWFARSNTGTPSPNSVAKDEVVFTFGPDDHIKGNNEAKVTLVEFGDFQCPACAAYSPVLMDVLKQNEGVLRIVYKHFPLIQIHLRAQAAAQASVAAGLQGKFWEMYVLLFDNQNEWASKTGTADFEKYAAQLGLDINKFKSDYNSDLVKDKISSDLKEAIDLGLNSTPTFYLNGKKIGNPKTIQEFNDLIKSAENSQ